MLYLRPLIFSFILTCAFVPLIYWAAIKFLKWPNRPRDIHKGAVPRIGGVALIIVFWLAVFLDKNLIIDKPLWGLFIGSIVILIFGIWDDLKDLKPKIQLAVQALLALIIIGAGVSISYIRNPFGGEIRLDQWQLTIGDSHFSIIGAVFIIAWIILIINIINWLDGLDGLAGGVSLIGFVAIFLLSISSIINQPPIGILSIVLVGALLGFLIFNFPRKRGSIIFLGTSGSVFLGFMLGSLSILSGSKVATALLVLGLAVLDAFWVIWQRIKNKAPIWKGDNRHLHHQLLRAGLSQKQVVILFWLVSAAFGAIALISGTQGKLLAFLGLCAIMGSIVFTVKKLKNIP
ncbi:MAG: undecaprenyl/decaprenyl-phosphate alpha-N-acetylglucosaminyl 1-phosphate transferase [Candidatus Portnoybacteria bacterium]|nr:undecaprenyl/decaprenyl-phosphate alpha-N-acetylglucosaminyl 1-phosphate transferase [Candidatus Portnoybacteria bacterium]